MTAASGYDTGYSYDVLDNLTHVRQYTMGDRSTYQERSFVYDSLSRLGSKTHPESGTASYQYDANGNLKRRTDARGIATTYSYDSLDRLKTTDYTDGTPTTTVTYDQGANGKGRPATASGGSGADAFHYHYDGYDGMGRVLNLRTTLGNRQFDAVYCYNFVGGITQVDYPDTHPSPGFVWEYEYDGQGRQQEMRSTSSGQTETLIDGYRKIYGRSTSTETTLYAINGTQEKITYNNRMQPTRRSVALTATPTTKLMDLRYSFRDPTSSGNNGNVYRMTDRAQSTTQGKQYYSYDYLQRLTEVRLGSRTSSNKIAYGYDRWGNRTSSATKGTVTNFMACSTDCAVDATTNRISNWRYDAAGNPIGISTSTLQWDGAGRLESIDSGATASYSHDHLGRRILKRAPSDNTQYFYDVTGKVLWEFDPDGTGDHQKMVRAYFNGRLFTSTGDAAAGSHTVYTDHLETPRLKLHVMTAASEARDDYYPFGQQVNTVVDAAHDRRFTGKERDAESGLDYFGARYYHSVAGRFLSVDPVLDSADPINPQSWNRYAYTFNNPLKYVDPDGLCPVPADTNNTVCIALFIEASEVQGYKGDDREFSSNSDASQSRVYLHVNVGEKDFNVVVNPSSKVGGEEVAPLESNRMSVTFDADGGFSVAIAATNSAISLPSPAINATFTFRPDGSGGFEGQGDRDAFPSAEAYHWRRGVVKTLFKRRETTWFSLFPFMPNDKFKFPKKPRR